MIIKTVLKQLGQILLTWDVINYCAEHISYATTLCFGALTRIFVSLKF